MSGRRSRSVLGGNRSSREGGLGLRRVSPFPGPCSGYKQQLATITVMGRACRCSLWSVIDWVPKKMFDRYPFSERSPKSPSSWFVSPPLRNIVCLTRRQYVVPVASSDTFEGQLNRGRRVNLLLVLAGDVVKCEGARRGNAASALEIQAQIMIRMRGSPLKSESPRRYTRIIPSLSLMPAEQPKSVVLVTGGTGLVGYGIQHIVETEPVGSRFGKREGETWVFLSSKDADLRLVTLQPLRASLL
jgi:hypothetical protein